MKVGRHTGPLWDADCMVIDDDFTADQSDLFWIDTVTDTGTAAVGDTVGGVMVLTPSDATVADNDEVYLGSANEVFQFLADRPIYGRCYLKFTETASGVYNCFFGFINAVAADTMVDNGGGMRASGSLVAIYKVDGGTVWRATARNGSEVTDSISTTTSTSTSYQMLEIYCEDWDNTTMTFGYKVNGRPLLDSNQRPIRHSVLVASSTEMQLAVGAKLGAVTNNDPLLVDYIYGHQYRNPPVS